MTSKVHWRRAQDGAFRSAKHATESDALVRRSANDTSDNSNIGTGLPHPRARWERLLIYRRQSAAGALVIASEPGHVLALPRHADLSAATE
jgi:hypothetical protein